MTESLTRTLVAAVSGSWLVQVCRRLMTSMQERPAALPDRVVEDDLTALRALLTGSALAAPMAPRVRRAAGAIAASNVVHAAAEWRTKLGELPRWQLIRAVGIAGLTAVAADAVLGAVDPRPVSIYRWLLWMGAAIVSVGFAAGARSFDAARRESRVLRHL